MPILYVSHAIDEVARPRHTLVLIDGGTVRAAGPAGALLPTPATSGFLGLRDAGALLNARIVAHHDDGLTELETSAAPALSPRSERCAGARA